PLEQIQRAHVSGESREGASGRGRREGHKWGNAEPVVSGVLCPCGRRSSLWDGGHPPPQAIDPGRRGPRHRPLFDLAPPRACPFHPPHGGSSLWRWSSPHGGRVLPAWVPSGAPTFLSAFRRRDRLTCSASPILGDVP